MQESKTRAAPDRVAGCPKSQTGVLRQNKLTIKSAQTSFYQKDMISCQLNRQHESTCNFFTIFYGRSRKPCAQFVHAENVRPPADYPYRVTHGPICASHRPRLRPRPQNRPVRPAYARAGTQKYGSPVLSKIQCVSHTGIFSLPHRQTCLPHLFCRLLPVSFHKRWRNHRPFDKLYTPGFGWCLCLVVPYEGLHREIITTRFSTKSSSMQSGPTRSPLGCCLLDLIWSCAYS